MFGLVDCGHGGLFGWAEKSVGGCAGGCEDTRRRQGVQKVREALG